MIKLNNTPVRTSRNFNINNICIEDIEYEKLKKCDFAGLKIENMSNSIYIKRKVNKDIKFKYGLCEKLDYNILNKEELNIRIDSKNGEKVTLEYNLDEKESNILELINIIASKDSNAKIIIKLKSCDIQKSISNIYLNANLEEGAILEISIINLLSKEVQNLIAIENTLNERSVLNYNIIDFGSKCTVLNYYTNLAKEKSENNINCMYLGDNSQLFDYNYICHLNAPKSKVNMDVKGALSDTSKKHFKGTLDFKKGAEDSFGSEDEFCYLLSESARSISLPMLLCAEEKVEGNHSSASGNVDEKLLFYLMTRGFSKKDALKIIIKAKFNSIIEKISDSKLKEEILREIDKKLK